ncbi:hypothetical protein GW17_00051480 [Ensete ventricosum]|nr:hypothetical protein GW17_00051480 [Ensete ventricosum]
MTISYKILRDLILFSLVQQNFDVAWCRGAVKEKILLPWLESMRLNGLKFWENKRVTDFIINEDTGCISGLVCGQELYKADAFVLAVGISTVQSTILSSRCPVLSQKWQFSFLSFLDCLFSCSPVLQSRQEFLSVLNLAAIDVISVKLWFDRKVNNDASLFLV